MTEAILLDIADISVGSRFRQNLGNLDSLAQSIDAIGLLHPIVVTPERELVAGRRRIEACKRLGWSDIPCRVMPLSPAEMLRAEHDENEVRLEFKPSERVAIGRALEEEVARQARERQRHGQTAPGRNACGPGPQPEGGKGRTRDIVGGAVGWGGRTYERAKAVIEAAETDPDTYGDIAKQMDNTGQVKPAYTETKRRQQEVSNGFGYVPSNKRFQGAKHGYERIAAAAAQIHAATHALNEDEELGIDADQATQLLELVDQPYRILGRFRKQLIELSREHTHA